jgi:hypothetical protein
MPPDAMDEATCRWSRARNRLENIERRQQRGYPVNASFATFARQEFEAACAARAQLRRAQHDQNF